MIKENCLLHKTKPSVHLKLIFNLEKTDFKRILYGMIYEILDGVASTCLSIDSTKTLVHALVTSRLDHCNSLLYGLPDYLIQRLQYVMNAAAKVITCKRTFDHITPLLIELHRLSVHWLTLRDLHNSLYDTKAEFNNCFIIHLK